MSGWRATRGVVNACVSSAKPVADGVGIGGQCHGGRDAAAISGMPHTRVVEVAIMTGQAVGGGAADSGRRQG